MAGKVNRNLAEWLIVGLIIFSLIIEWLLHKLERYVGSRDNLKTVLKNLYRELMILGMVSFGFILFIFIAEPPADVTNTFEVAHIFIFLFGVFHTIVVCSCIFMSLRMSVQWEQLEEMDVSGYKETKRHYLVLKKRLDEHHDVVWRFYQWWFPNPMRLFRLSRLHEAVTFTDNCLEFIDYYKLPFSFHYSKLLRKAKSSILVELVEIHWSHFAFLLLMVLLDIARSPLKWHPNFEPYFLIGNSIFNIFIVTVLSAKIRRVHWKLTRNPRLYFESEETQKEQETSENATEGCDRQDGRKSHAASDNCFPTDTNSTDQVSPNITKNSKSFESRKMDQSNSGFFEDSSFSIYDKLWRRSRQSREDNEHRPSTDLITAISKEEEGMKSLLHRTSGRRALSLDLSNAIENKQQGNIEGKQYRQEDWVRIQERRRLNVRISQNYKDAEAVQEIQKAKYPPILLIIVPRLKRQATAVEKLFWFGSQNFFKWCVEFVLFFSTINLSSAIAKLAFEYKERKDSDAKDNAIEEETYLLVIALITAIVCLIYVLINIAAIMKKLIIVLSNGGLFSKDRTREIIEKILIDSIDIEKQNKEIKDINEKEEHKETESNNEVDFSEMRKKVSMYIKAEGRDENC